MSDSAPHPFADLVGVAAPLIADAGIAESRAIGSVDQYDRRAYVRALFALVEGLNHCFRVVAGHEGGALALEAGRLARETARRGGEKSGPALKLMEAFEAFKTAHRISTVPAPQTTDGWSDFRGATLVRNRVTHPNVPADCIVSDADFDCVRRAHVWYQTQSEILMAHAAGKDPTPLTGSGGGSER